jgi:glycerol-1-phosphate dehydrogenase [NAD(P)+]
MKVEFPLGIDICENEAERKLFFDRMGVELGSDYVVLTGQGISSSYAKQVIKKMRSAPKLVLNIDSNTIESTRNLEKRFIGESAVILGIGGGKVCDVAKRVAYLSGLKLILFPTIISNDGLISPISVLSEQQKSFSLAGKMPEHVFIDLDIIKKSPQQFLIAAACDILSNISATSDWQYAAAQGEARLNFLALQFSNIAAHMLLDCSSWELNSPEFLRAIVHGQILSAMAMAYAGNSRPCSGSEHLIGHALDELGLDVDVLHGEKVGRAARFCLYVQGKSNPKIDKLLEKFGIPGSISNEVLSDQMLVNVFRVSRTVRPGRKTILDRYEDEELVTKYREFEANQLR